MFYTALYTGMRLGELQGLRWCDVDFNMASLRHSHATLLLKAGIHPKIVSERLGHANIGITLDTYSHVLPGLQERAAQCFDEMLEPRVIEDVSKMLAKDPSPDSTGR